MGAAARRPAIRVAAPAKINLSLRVTGRRPDGYHELDSLVAFADIGDEVTAASGDRLTLAIEGRFAGALAAESDNLVLRAARLLADALGRAPRAALRLTKNLPVASGIGGGSSDAAATLRALVALWQASIAEDRLAVLARGLGADVPVCLYGRPAWLGGIGERLDPAPPLPPVAIVLVNPGVALATAAVFKARGGPLSPPARFTEGPRDAADLAEALRRSDNDLTAAATGLVPEIAAVLAALEASEGALLARMSGSGATCFALFAEPAGAVRAARRIAAARPAWWSVAARLRDCAKAAPGAVDPRGGGLYR